MSKEGSNGDKIIKVYVVAGYDKQFSLRQRSTEYFMDGGASVNFVTFDKANLIRENVKLSIVKIGWSKEEVESAVYGLPLLDKTGNVIEFQFYGIEKRSLYMNSIDVAGVLHLFRAVNQDDVRRPCRSIEVLIGFECAVFHLVRVQLSSHLLLLENQFWSVSQWIASQVARESRTVNSACEGSSHNASKHRRLL